MHYHRVSYWKSIIAVGVVAIVSAVSFLVWIVKGWGVVGAVALFAVFLLSGLTVGGGWICLVYDSRVRGVSRQLNAAKAQIE